jgi:ankyrin repeat protein
MNNIDDFITNGHTLLTKAVEDGMEDEVLNLIEQGANINKENRMRDTPLLKAIENLNVNIIKILVENNVDVNYMSSRGITPLVQLLGGYDFEKINDNIRDIFKILINAGAIVNDTRYPKDNRNTILYIPMLNNDIEIINILLEKNININYENEIFNNSTPLEYAILSSTYYISKLLIEHGADVVPIGYTNIINVALEYGKELKFIELLLRAGADPTYSFNINTTDKMEQLFHENIEFRDLFIPSIDILPIYEKFFTFDKKYIVSTFKQTTLNNFMALSLRGYWYLLTKFIHLLEDQLSIDEFGKMINLQDSTGNTALHYACISAKRYDDVNTIELLIKNGANKYIKNKANNNFYYYLKNFPELSSLKSKYGKELSEELYRDETTLYSQIPKDVFNLTQLYI